MVPTRRSFTLTNLNLRRAAVLRCRSSSSPVVQRAFRAIWEIWRGSAPPAVSSCRTFEVSETRRCPTVLTWPRSGNRPQTSKRYGSSLALNKRYSLSILREQNRAQLRGAVSGKGCCHGARDPAMAKPSAIAALRRFLSKTAKFSMDGSARRAATAHASWTAS